MSMSDQLLATSPALMVLLAAQLISARSFYFYTVNTDPHKLLNQNETGYFNLGVTNITTLSQSGTMGAPNIWGDLWAPSLSPADQALCANETYQIPASVSSMSNNISLEYDQASSMVAIAPWASSPACQQAYFSAVNAASMRALITFIPDNSTDAPLAAGSPVWSLDDGGSWKSSLPFPVYAISGAAGAAYMDILTSFSMPDSRRLPMTTYWIYAEIGLTSSNSWAVLPDLWTIVLAVLAAFVAILAGVSGVLHLLQRKRRRDLRRRIMTGTVSLEDIGIRKLTVPQALMDKMPVRKYSSLAGQDSLASASVAPEKQAAAASHVSDIGPAMAHSYNQPTCPICLDDFEPDSDVRCLPCDHIFHPECCDSFLLENSSLCPMCKKSVLPKGYCPEKITNAMVRRERLARLRELEAQRGAGAQPSSSWHLSAANRMRHALNGQNAQGQSQAPSGIPGGLSAPPQAVEMQPQPPITSTTQDAPSSSTAPIRPASAQPPAPGPGQECTPGRREWARRRALQLLGPQAQTDAVVEEDVARQASVPRWRRAVAKVFPSSPS